MTDLLIEELQTIGGFNIEGRYPQELIDLKKKYNLKMVNHWQKRVTEILNFLEQQL